MSLPPAQKRAKLLSEKEESNSPYITTKIRVTSKKAQEELLMADYDSIDSSSSIGSGSNVSTSLAYSQTAKPNNVAMSPIEDSADFLSDDIEELSQAEVSLINFVSYRDYSPPNEKEERKEEVTTKKLSGKATDTKSKQTNVVANDYGSKQSKKM